MDKERAWLLKEKYNGVESPEFLADLKHLNDGEPLAYLIGNIPFYNCTIDLSYKPLIPRVETEYWVNHFVEKKLRGSTSQNGGLVDILDIFSGSGCIGVSVMKNSNAKVDFSELKPKNIEQIKKNLELNCLTGEVFKSDVFESLPDKKYDYILANPPYISKGRLDTVGDSVMDHEDHGALFAENEGLFFIEKLIKESAKFLKPGGKVYVEYDPWQTEKIIDLLKESSVTNFEIKKDQYEKDRVLVFSL